MNNLFRVIIVFLLSGIFLLAGISKAMFFNDFLALLLKYELFPISIIPFLALLIVGLEITTGICILIPQLRKKATLFASSMLAVFSISIIYVQIKGLDINCGCFTFLKDRKMGFGLAIQDLTLLLLALLLYKLEKRKRISQTNGKQIPALFLTNDSE